MATSNGHSDSRAGEGGRLKGRQTPGGVGEVQPSDDRRDANMASPSFHMKLAMRFCLQVFVSSVVKIYHSSLGI